MLNKLINETAQYYLNHEIDPVDTSDGSKVMDAKYSWAAVVCDSELGLADTLELAREIDLAFDSVGSIQGDGLTLKDVIIDAVTDLDDGSPLIQLIVEQIERAVGNYSEHLNARMKKYNVTTV